jgi:hypothetical protein
LPWELGDEVPNLFFGARAFFSGGSFYKGQVFFSALFLFTKLQSILLSSIKFPAKGKAWDKLDINFQHVIRREAKVLDVGGNEKRLSTFAIHYIRQLPGYKDFAL